ncbi:MAG: hypothetical protein KTR21_10295, partial [Rhodobacteraceae bacterium]|nr:hypothetical protein [Paracoccaceae bacterium]
MALLVSAVIGFYPNTSDAETTNEVFLLLLENPDDAELNLRFGRLAEQEGSYRHALAAYERALRANPDNGEAFHAYERAKRRLAPPQTSVVVVAGSTYRSNVRQNPGRFDQPTDITFDGGLDIVDERSVGGFRLRSLGDLAFRLHADVDDLDEITANAWTGPTFAIAPDIQAHVAIGGGASWFEDRLYYGEGSVRASLAFIDGRTIDVVRLYVGYRELNEKLGSQGALDRMPDDLR